MSSSPIQIRILRRTTTPDEYRVYRAGLEWDLTDPIVLEKRGDLKSEQSWRDRVEPYHHQVANLITFCRRLPVTLLADDVGLGKTISAGLIISELISRSRLSKILIVCPKILGPQWQEELLTKFGLASEIAIGKDLIGADPEGIGAIITTYDSAREQLDSIPQDRFQMLVLDEAHKLRNLYGPEKPPKVAKCFRKALEARRFRFVLMLTATPIQNRLWDLYSLVDLLAVARGHENPFGSEGMFARKFIADSREQARQLKPDARDEFRSIIYGYISRVRRGDAKLYFPDRVVQMHRVDPTPAELQLISVIARPIQKLNRLVQISILQALTSSPQALLAQLSNMARNRTIPQELETHVRSVVTQMPPSAKLQGLGVLIDTLKQEKPELWRLVVFTGRIETQTTIQEFLERRGLKVGIINGTSGPRNQETVTRFRNNPPDCHVIVSTEAGSEGINLQVANVLVNYDLPWNPMIVEQRIGRVQRLGGEHASVAIYNVILSGTFEEYIVGRLMEKLQMAAHAIGDIEALLEASGIGGDEEGGKASFDEQIRLLVIAALAGKDYQAATQQAVQSIDLARATLEREEQAINTMLGGMDGVEYLGPRAPTLPNVLRSMEPRDFTLAAFKSLGASITPQAPDLYLVEENGGREHIRFDESTSAGRNTKLYAPGTAPFLRLVGRITATGSYDVEDLNMNSANKGEDLACKWVLSFGGTPGSVEVRQVRRCFEGKAVVRARATVAHDSYERLIEVPCSPAEHGVQLDPSGLGPLPNTIEDPTVLGIDTARLADAVRLDDAISEFSRFYLERREREIQAVADERKRKKLMDEFTPRLEMTLVAVQGKLYRQLKIHAHYTIDAEHGYYNFLVVTPHTEELTDAPEMGLCARSARMVPKSCLKRCEISGTEALQHFLVRSEISSRLAQPEFTVLCSLSGKRVLSDEAELSAVSGCWVAGSLLKTSVLSGRRAEPVHFGRCAFTRSEVLDTELSTSELSGKSYRIDEQMRSTVSGRTGHRSEFLLCYETQQPVAVSEAEQCEITGRFVRPGLLDLCAITQKRVLASELERCTATGKRALKRLLVTSSLTEARILEEVAFRSATGKFCSSVEAKTCLWSSRKYHPDDLRVCELTHLPIYFEFATTEREPRLQPLVDLLNGIKRTEDMPELWDTVTSKVTAALAGGRCRVEAAVLSPDKRHLAVCVEVRTLLGFRVRQAGLVYAIGDCSIVGLVVQGRRRDSEGWSKI